MIRTMDPWERARMRHESDRTPVPVARIALVAAILLATWLFNEWAQGRIAQMQALLASGGGVWQ